MRGAVRGRVLVQRRRRQSKGHTHRMLFAPDLWVRGSGGRDGWRRCEVDGWAPCFREGRDWVTLQRKRRQSKGAIRSSGEHGGAVGR